MLKDSAKKGKEDMNNKVENIFYFIFFNLGVIGNRIGKALEDIEKAPKKKTSQVLKTLIFLYVKIKYHILKLMEVRLVYPTL
jgi:hypothetical protein